MRRATWVISLLAVLLVAWPLPAAHASALAPRCASLENCYSYGEMREFYVQVVGLVDGFAGTVGGLSRPRYVYVGSGQAVPIACGGVADATAFFYCQRDRTVYIGQDQLWDFYTSTGDGGAAFGVAHEWGHYVQDVAGVLASFAEDDQRARIRSENQADCIGGAFLGHARERGILEPDDYDDVSTILPQIAAAEADLMRDHGTLQERLRAVRQGFDGGLAACNAFFPDQPLVT
jgi:predicted metalloprotease